MTAALMINLPGNRGERHVLALIGALSEFVPADTIETVMVVLCSKTNDPLSPLCTSGQHWVSPRCLRNERAW